MFQEWQHRKHLFRYVLAAMVATGCMVAAGHAVSQAVAPAVRRQLGTIASVAPASVTLVTDAGQRVLVQVAAGAKLVKLPAGSKDMKDAQTIELKDVAVGDRVLVRGKAGDEQGSFVASSVVVMKGDDIQQKRQQEQQDWQRRGTGGLVSSVDTAANTIAISTVRLGVAKKTVIHLSSTTVVRRYAPDSVKFEDAQPGTVAQIQPGDQLRARGNRNPEGDVDAEEIVSGSFRNVAGTIAKLDAASGMLEVKDAATQKTVAIKIGGDSQVLRLPPMAAQMMARRAGVGQSAAPVAAGTASPGVRSPVGKNSQIPGHEPPDLQQLLSGLPKMPLGELHPGDAVMIVATPGSSSGQGTVITLLAGVEAILAATPRGSQAMTLSPWNINGNAGDSSPTQ